MNWNPLIITLYRTVLHPASLGFLAHFAAHCPQRLRLHRDPPIREAVVR